MPALVTTPSTTTINIMITVAQRLRNSHIMAKVKGMGMQEHRTSSLDLV